MRRCSKQRAISPLPPLVFSVLKATADTVCVETRTHSTHYMQRWALYALMHGVNGEAVATSMMNCCASPSPAPAGVCVMSGQNWLRFAFACWGGACLREE